MRYEVLRQNEKLDTGNSSRKLNDDSSKNNNDDRRMAITQGVLKNLVIPFKFKDHTKRTLPSRSDLDILMNNEGPNSNVCPTGSVRDVYKQNSFNKLDVQSTVIDWVTIDYNEAYCANGNSGLSTRFHICLTNALDKAVRAGVDFSNFDVDRNGHIDGITFFHSSYAAEFGGNDADGTGIDWRIWSHRWAIFSTNWSNNGVRVYDYHVNPALWSTSGSRIGRIGVVAHELGHFLGLPDLYDYNDANDALGKGNGIGSWGLMANSWGFDGSQLHPPYMSAWSKKELGWVTPRIVSTSDTYSLSQACDNADMIMITEGYTNSEYLLIENRQPCGFEATMPQGGLAIFHIDESMYEQGVRGYPGQSNWPGNGNHYKIAVLPADGRYDLENDRNRGDGTDLFRGGYVNSIGPNGIPGSAHPNTNAYRNGDIVYTGLSITNISASGSTMTLDITVRTFIFPKQGVVGPIECGQTVQGNTVDGVNNYNHAAPEHLYSFSLNKETNVKMSSCGSAFDTVVSVFGETGNLLGSNDDSCGV